MGLESGLKLGQKVITAWTKARTSNSLLAMKPVKVNIEGLKFAPKLETDVLKISHKTIQMTPEAIIDHGSLVMQSRILPNRIQRDMVSGIEYINASRNDIFLAHSVSNKTAVENLTYLIEQSNKGNKIYLSSSLINKNSSLFNGDSAYGVILKNRSANVTTAGYGQVSNYKKTYEQFLQDINSLYSCTSAPQYNFIKNETLQNFKKAGIGINDFEYVELFNKLKNYEFFDQIPSEISIGNKILKGSTVREAIEKAHADLAFKELNRHNVFSELSNGIEGGCNTEVASLIDGIQYLYARVNNISEVAPEIMQIAKQNNLKIVLLGKPTIAKTLNDVPEYKRAVKKIKEYFLSKRINLVKKLELERNLKQKFQPIVDELNKELKAQTTLENLVCGM